MSFRWLSKDAAAAAATLAFLRVKCRGMPVDQAVRSALEHGRCRNPSAISDATFQRICRAVEQKIKDERNRTG